jgi:hypothetical protein
MQKGVGRVRGTLVGGANPLKRYVSKILKGGKKTLNVFQHGV